MSTSSVPGGPAAKAGDIYEALWGVQGFMHLLIGEVNEIQIELPGEDGAEFSFRVGGTTQWWQTKRQVTGQNNWSIAKLKRVLAYFAEKAKAGDECVFASISDAPELRELADRARNATTCAVFKSHFLGGDRESDFEELREAWGSVSEQDAYEWLKRIHVAGGTEWTIEGNLLAFARLLFDGNQHTTLSVLRDLYLNSPHQSFDRDTLCKLLESKHAICARSEVLRLLPADVDTIIASFDKFSSSWHRPRTVGESWIPRSEEQRVLDETLKAGNRPICLLGVPGSGKTSLLAKIAEDCRVQDHVVVAIKADLVPEDESFDAWSQAKLGMGLRLIDAIRLVARRRTITVIVDQLDALSSLVDLTSGRLNDLLDFIVECAGIENVLVICSCREFEYHHDTRFAKISAAALRLELPSWETIAQLLCAAGIANADKWPTEFREILRVPQHLHVFLKRYRDTGNTDPFPSYQLMLDDLWERSIQSEEERDVLYRLADMLTDKESLWVPAVYFESESDRVAITALESKELILRREATLGFRHQTLLEHARARNFTRQDQSLYNHVFARQHAVHVRPTLWAVLSYLRNADRSRYHSELERFRQGTLRLHVRYLLIDFLGQISDPDEIEVLTLSHWLVHSEDRHRVLIAIRGREAWFRVLLRSHLPTVMHWPITELWPMIGVITAAWSFARNECIALSRESLDSGHKQG